MTFNLSKNYIINILLSFIPISFVAGNLILNLNILLILFCSFVFYGREILKINLFYLDKLIILFFAYLLIVGLYNNIYVNYISLSINDFTIINKTLLFFRFLFLYFILRYLVEKELINFKLLFFSCGLSTLFVSLDLVYQFYSGSDIFGYKIFHPRRMSGPFGSELIAGSFLQRFSIFAFFLIIIFYKDKKIKFKNFFLASFFSILFFGLIIAGNRIPAIFFTLMIFLIFIFEKQLRKYIISFLILVTIIFSISYNASYDNIGNHYLHLVIQTKGIFKQFDKKYTEFDNIEKKYKVVDERDGYHCRQGRKTDHGIDSAGRYTVGSKEEAEACNKRIRERYSAASSRGNIFLRSTYTKELYTGYKTWLLNKYFGGGVKSFRINCSKVSVNCSTHPHNYYLEILADTGLVGFILLLIIFVAVFYETFIKRYLKSTNLKDNLIIVPFIFLFFTEIFPIRTTGSFFTTGNATYIFLIMAITIALSKKKLN